MLLLSLHHHQCYCSRWRTPFVYNNHPRYTILYNNPNYQSLCGIIKGPWSVGRLVFCSFSLFQTNTLVGQPVNMFCENKVVTFSFVVKKKANWSFMFCPVLCDVLTVWLNIVIKLNPNQIFLWGHIKFNLEANKTYATSRALLMLFDVR